ncbi:MAG: hypothetical protein M3R48_01645 [Candidatus Dormibacteraeota bacterium]|nr:hypothetical protein [Candidatus Dormibacteraeota bacterium]
MTEWDGDDLALLTRAASDLTALAATVEVLRRRQPADPTVRRAQLLVERLHGSVTDLLEQLRE